MSHYFCLETFLNEAQSFWAIFTENCIIGKNQDFLYIFFCFFYKNFFFFEKNRKKIWKSQEKSGKMQIWPNLGKTRKKWPKIRKKMRVLDFWNHQKMFLVCKEWKLNSLVTCLPILAQAWPSFTAKLCHFLSQNILFSTVLGFGSSHFHETLWKHSWFENN